MEPTEQGPPGLFARSTHRLGTVQGCALPLVQDVNRCPVKQQQLHHEDVLSRHGLVQGRVAPVVACVDGDPVLQEKPAHKGC